MAEVQPPPFCFAHEFTSFRTKLPGGKELLVELIEKVISRREGLQRDHPSDSQPSFAGDLLPDSLLERICVSVTSFHVMQEVGEVEDRTLRPASDKKLLGILSMKDLYEIPGKEFMDMYVARRVREDFKLRVIRTKAKEVEETWPSSISEGRELRYAPEHTSFPMTIYLYDKKVAMIGTLKENFGMIIESEDFYQTQKQMFESLWKISDPQDHRRYLN